MSPWKGLSKEIMLKRQGLVATLVLCAATLAACGGGGGGGSSPPSGGGSPTPVPTGSGGGTPTPGHSATPAPTPVPSGVATTLPSSSPANPSQVSVNSNPTGLNVTIDGTSAGTTGPLTPTVGYGVHTIVITPKTTASPYSVAISNTGAAPISVFYNQPGDSLGAIKGGVATSSIGFHRPEPPVAASVLTRSLSSAASRPAFAPGKIAVQYDTGSFTGARTFSTVESAHGIAKVQNFVQSGNRVTRILTVNAGQNVDATVAALRSEPGVVYASRVGLRYPAASSTGTFYPNDTYFNFDQNGANGDQWYLWLVDAQDAWGYGQGKAPIAVIDSGYDPNQTDLASQVAYSETILDLLVYKNTATDTDGHGTFLSGLAGAKTNNGAGFAGASYNSPLQEYKIFANGSASAQTTDEAAAIRDAVANGAKVIMLALQSNPAFGPDPVERDAVAFAIQSGVTVVASSGDDGLPQIDYPAAYPGVISVGASIVNDAGTPGVVVGQGNKEQVASYSNFGSGLGLVAPGGQGTSGDTTLIHWIENLYTTQPWTGLPACPSGTAAPDCKILYTGTSPAAAIVAGTASLMLSVNSALTPAQVAQMLYASTDDIKDTKEGHGRLNMQRAVALAAGDPSPQPALPLPRAVQFVAIAYTNSGAALPVAPAIVDSVFPNGVPVNQDGTFRIADVNPANIPKSSNGAYKIAVWLSLAGDGKVHPGDYFTTVACNVAAPCAIGNITAGKLAATATTLP
jgi:hypothetical protein